MARRKKVAAGSTGLGTLYEPTLKKMLDSVRKLDPAKIKPTDIAASGGPPLAEEG